MATAKFTAGKTEMVEKVIEPATVTLVLSIEEAQVLLDIGAKIGGSLSSRRRLVDAIVGAIRSAEPSPQTYRQKHALKLPWGDISDISRGIQFELPVTPPKGDCC
jgi:hypothetical protein